MKRLSYSVMGLLILCGMLLGFTRVKGVTVVEDAASIVVPYESLGWVEVSRKAPLIQYRRVGGLLVQWCSFGYFHNPSQETYLRGLLNKKLVQASQKQKGVDAIINAKYWPDLIAGQFPKGLIFAKGEMIRYRRVTV